MKKALLLFLICSVSLKSFCWGFFAHRQINYYAVFLLPPEMLVLYKPQILFLSEHAIDPDKRRYAIAEEGARHYIDIDHYGAYPFPDLPRNYDSAVAHFSIDTVQQHGIVPWWIQIMMMRLTRAFKEKNQSAILKLSAELGHYVADAHVPLHASSNHNGQLTGQKGIHGFWESRIPELLSMKEWDFQIGKAQYIPQPAAFVWNRVLESALAADTVLLAERMLTAQFAADQKYAYEERNEKIVRQYSTAFSKAYDQQLKGMVERRMRQSIFAVASLWYTAWINAGQPDLTQLGHQSFTPEELKDFEDLNTAWRNQPIKGREEEQ